MAKSVQFTSGSLFIGNPIIISIESESISESVTFHRVKVFLEAALSSDGSKIYDYTFSSPVESGEVIDMDISSALRSVSENFTYSVNTERLEYPYIAYRMTVWDEYMLEGILHEKIGCISLNTWNVGLMGGFSDFERISSGATKNVRFFSRKPFSVEIVKKDSIFICPVPFLSEKSFASLPSSGPITKGISFEGKIGLQQVYLSDVYSSDTDYDHTIIEGDDELLHTLYFLDSPLLYCFSFVNGLGVVESICASSLIEETLEISANEYVKSYIQSFNGINCILSVNTKNQRSLKFSTGVINKEWQEWWLNEFLVSKQVWIFLSGKWIPCVISLEDSFSIVKYSSNDFREVQFTVKLGINGGYSSLLN